jgi:hypothetical protein
LVNLARKAKRRYARKEGVNSWIGRWAVEN